VKIALVSTVKTAVPPPKAGSIELIVGLLAEELVRRGHEVTVFATGDSPVSAPVVSVLPTGYRHDTTIWEWYLAEFMNLGAAFERADEFDVISSHVYCYALPFTRLVRTPTIHTFHIVPTPDFVRYCGLYREGRYVMVSEYQRELFPGVPVTAVIPNGIDTRSYPLGTAAGGYLAYIGDFTPDKDPLAAIRLAQAAGVPLRLAGPESSYLEEVVRPQLDSPDVEYVGELDHAAKAEFLGDALASLFISRGREAFGLVLIESMACGTPVLALGHGPVREIVDQGASGFYADDLEALAARVEEAGRLDRREVRRLAQERFDTARMVDDYVRIFERIA
jgi:glycosyltransferase involved in cell wall biosynthesis